MSDSSKAKQFLIFNCLVVISGWVEHEIILMTRGLIWSLVYMHNLHPVQILLPGTKLHTGVNLHPLKKRSYVNKLCSYVIGFAL